MGKKVSTCVYINREILETAERVGLNISQVQENALVDSMRRLMEPKQGTSLQSLTSVRAGAGI
ncbi:MAG: type II toxin-antitoxin system CcdA family antitoxin [Candidatus Bathyarchaeota archaeon]|nr:MAG: type II toxin-antitoxin system CcdA family antitoxin [Candidatus Bathyarchaeota archaeon]